MSRLDGLDNQNPVEHRFLIETRKRLHARDPWTRGLYAEALVASVLPGAQLAGHSASPHDIEWNINGISMTIAVRTTGTYSMDYHETRNAKPFAGSWKFERPVRAWDPKSKDFLQDSDGEILKKCWADVAVLCRHTSIDVSDGWEFFVIPDRVIETWPAKTLTPKSVSAAGYRSVTSDELELAVQTTANNQ